MWRVGVLGVVLGGCDLFFGAPSSSGIADATSDTADGLEPNFEATRIIVYTTDGTATLPGATVHFVAPDQTTIKEVITDQEGVASASTPPDSTVIVYQKDALQLGPLVKIFKSTTPGDTIIAGRRRQQGTGALGSVTFQLSSFPAAAGYRVNVSCASPTGFSTTPVIAVQVTNCPSILNATAIGWAVDGTGAAISGPALLRGFNLSGVIGSTVQFDGYRELDVMTMTPSFTNIPPTATDVTWTERLFLDVDVLATEFEVPLPVSSMPAFSTFDWSIGTLRYKPEGGFGEVRVDLVQDSGVTAFPFDANAMIRGIKQGRYSGARNAIEWEEEAGGIPGEIIHVVASLTNTERRLQLQIHAPYGSSRSIPLPPLPAEVALAPNSAVQLYLTTKTISGWSYSQMLSTADTNPGFTPVYWDPSFEGKVLEAHD